MMVVMALSSSFSAECTTGHAGAEAAAATPAAATPATAEAAAAAATTTFASRAFVARLVRILAPGLPVPHLRREHRRGVVAGVVRSHAAFPPPPNKR